VNPRVRAANAAAAPKAAGLRIVSRTIGSDLFQRFPARETHQHGASPLKVAAARTKKADAAKSRGFGIQLRRPTH
jgi:hypothetical protein